MNHSNVKMLLLVFVLFAAVGGYYFVTTNAPPTDKPRASVGVPTDVETTNVTNVHIEKRASATTITGPNKDLIDPTSLRLGFTGYSPAATHDGTFNHITADLLVDKNSLQGGRIEIDMASVDAGIDRLNKHLQSEDFFDVNRFPTAIFHITRVKSLASGGTIEGTLTFRGVSKSLILPYSQTARTLSGDFLLDVTPFAFHYVGINKDVRLTWSISLR